MGIERYVDMGQIIQILSATCLILLVSTVISVGYSVYLSGKKEKGFGYILRVKENTGEPVSTEIYKNDTLNIGKNEIEFFLKKFIADTRTITLDRKIFESTIKNTNLFLTSETQKKVQSILSNEGVINFFDLKKTREVEILSISAIPETKNTYQVRWREKEYNENGTLTQRRNLNSILKINFFTPNKEQVSVNPIGMIITDFNLTQEN
ncbi:type IV secretion system protein [Leptotrichia sp. OH3620_COT-345]|nr:type IV secretion system protein [Leptotrichia sp. OH3620_COT-345]